MLVDIGIILIVIGVIVGNVALVGIGALILFFSA